MICPIPAVIYAVTIAVLVVMGLSILLLKTHQVLRGLRNIYNPALKESVQSAGDKAMLARSSAFYDFGLPLVNVLPGSLHLPLSPSPIRIRSQLSNRIVNSFTARASAGDITATEMDAGLGCRTLYLLRSIFRREFPA